MCIPIGKPPYLQNITRTFCKDVFVSRIVMLMHFLLSAQLF